MDENVEMAIIQSDQMEDGLPAAVGADSEQAASTEDSIRSSSNAVISDATISQSTRSKGAGVSKFSAAKALASALSNVNEYAFVPVDDVENSEMSLSNNSTCEIPANAAFTISPLKTLKWTSKCKPPQKPAATKEMEFDKVTLSNGGPYEVYSETCSLDSLVDLAVGESNRYAAQQGQQFHTDSTELKAFLGYYF